MLDKIRRSKLVLLISR